MKNLLARMPFRLERHTIFYIDFEDKCPCIDKKIIGSIYTIGVLSANIDLF